MVLGAFYLWCTVFLCVCRICVFVSLCALVLSRLFARLGHRFRESEWPWLALAVFAPDSRHLNRWRVSVSSPTGAPSVWLSGRTEMTRHARGLHTHTQSVSVCASFACRCVCVCCDLIGRRCQTSTRRQDGRACVHATVGTAPNVYQINAENDAQQNEETRANANTFREV